MISPELLRRYQFFAGLDYELIKMLASAADEKHVEAEHTFFKEDEVIEYIYLVIEGAVSIVIPVPSRSTKHSVSEQLMGEMSLEDVTISTVGTGDVFGWSGLVKPHIATAGAKALTPVRVVAFDCKTLREMFEEEPEFGYAIIQKAAQVIGSRLRDLRIESLSALMS